MLPELSPKRRTDGRDWFPYYAGFSLEFAKQFLTLHCKKRHSLVLDPWGGAGTTSLAAVALGHKGYSIDINPALYVVGRAQLKLAQGFDPVPAVQTTLEELERLNICPLHGYADIAGLSGETKLVSWTYKLSTVSSEQAIFLACALATIRVFSSSHRKSNPTWRNVSLAEITQGRTQSDIAFTMGVQAARMRDAADKTRKSVASKSVATWASSDYLPLDDGVVDTVLTSPPYCTRIDYVVQTRPELEFLGSNNVLFRELRDLSIGTPTIKRSKSLALSRNTHVQELLTAIENHNSYAAGSYYLPFFQQYFNSLETSISEISRVCKKGASIGIVVQPSTFKDIHVDLPELVASIGADYGLSKLEDSSWRSRDMRNVNSASRKYLAGRELREHLVLLRKE